MRRARESNARRDVIPDHGLAIRCLASSASPPRSSRSRARTWPAGSKIRRAAYYTNRESARLSVPLPGLEPGASAFVARRSVLLSYRGKSLVRSRSGIDPGPPPCTGSARARRKSAPLGKYQATTSALKLADAENCFRVQEIEKAARIGFPMGGSLGMTKPMSWRGARAARHALFPA